MKVDATRKIEDTLHRCGDLRGDVNHRHSEMRSNENEISHGRVRRQKCSRSLDQGPMASSIS
jgi:hypothetical protein